MAWQAKVLFLAMIKLYCMSIILGSMTIYNTSFFDGEVITMKLTFMFGLVVFGNLVDNYS